RVLGEKWGVLVVALVATTPAFMRMSVMSHPDTLELACILLCLLAMICRLEQDRRRWTFVAAAAVGLAVAAKLGAFILLPLVWVVDAPWRRGEPAGSMSTRAARLCIGMVGVAAVCTAIVMTPGFVQRHLTSDGRIEDPLVLRLLPLLPVVGTLSGLLLAGLV